MILCFALNQVLYFLCDGRYVARLHRCGLLPLPGEVLRTLEGHAVRVVHAAFAPDGQQEFTTSSCEIACLQFSRRAARRAHRLFG